MVVFTPPGFWDFIMDLDGDGVNDVEQGLALRKSQIGMPITRSSTKSRRLVTTAQIKSLTPKRKRKVSTYQRVFGKHLKALKRKHPRTSTSILMKKAHRLTKRELK